MKTIIEHQPSCAESFIKNDNLESLTSLVRVVVTDDSGRQAIAFLGAQKTTRGIKFHLTAKQNDCRMESRTSATATFHERYK